MKRKTAAERRQPAAPIAVGPISLVGLLMGLWSFMGCAGSGVPFNSDQTFDFVTADTTQFAGPPVVAVYPRYRLRGEWPQQTLPLERADPARAGEVRTVVRFQLVGPLRERGDVRAELYAFTACEITDGRPCEPTRFTLFFAVQTPPGPYDARRFDMRPARRLTLILDDDTTLDAPQPAYESHATREGPLEELWFAVPAATFGRMVEANKLRFRFGRDDVRLGGRQMKPLRALWAATQGTRQLSEVAR